MRLFEAARIGKAPRLALTGAGGKTTAMFCLGRDLAGSAITKGAGDTALLTSTTHLAADQLSLSDYHFTINSPQDIDALGDRLPSGVVLLTGPLDPSQRTRGLDEKAMLRLLTLAETNPGGPLPLLVEADGSRQRPLKAPAGHEPVVPDWVDQVLVFAGLSALGKPLDSDWVHRPERFANLAGLRMDQEISIRALAKVMSSQKGGLKGLPASARRVAVLNQADTDPLREAGLQLAQAIQGQYAAVLVASLNAQDAQSQVHAVVERVAGVVLAAGASQRLGQPKQTLIWRGQALVHHAARTALQVGLSPVVIVTGAHAGPTRQAVGDLPVAFVHNADWRAGQSTSVVAGLGALPAEVGAAVFLLADQPQVPSELVRGLVQIHRRTLSPLVAPLVSDRRANPVLFDRVTFPDLRALSGDTGGRSLFGRYHVEWLPWQDVDILLDIDTAQDYQKLLSMGDQLRKED
jgi:molybdenum cofactor cytidylyltransferase